MIKRLTPESIRKATPPGALPGAGHRTRAPAGRLLWASLLLAVPVFAVADDCLPQAVTGYAGNHVRVLEGEGYVLHPAAELPPPECIVGVDAGRDLREIRLADGRRLWVPARDLRLGGGDAAARIRALGERETTAAQDRAGERHSGVKAIGDELERGE